MKTTSICMRLNGGVHVLLAVVIAALAFVLVPNGARAAAPDRQAYASASAFTTTCVEEPARQVCTDTSLYVFTGDNGTEVCVSISKYAISRRGEYTFISSEYGCAPVAADAFTFDDKNLASATLDATTVTLETYECTRRGCRVIASREATVAATFTGTGELMTFSSRSRFDDGTCTYTFSGKGIGREAAASITLDGQVIEASGFLSSSTSLTKVQCR